MSDPRLSAVDLSDRYGVSLVTIRRLCKRGLPHYRLGRLYRFDVAETDPWMREHGATPSGNGDDYRAAVKCLVDQAPPLTADQADRIRSILSGA